MSALRKTKATMPRLTPSSSKAPSQRQLRIAELIRHAVSDALTRGEIIDDVLTRHVITVPEVRMSPDLKVATVFVIGSICPAFQVGRVSRDRSLVHEALWLRSRVPRPAIGPYVRLRSARCGYDDPQSTTVRLEIRCATIVGSARSCLDRRSLM